MQTQFSDITLLYVEDDEIIRKQALMYLGRLFKKVWGAKDGLEALDMYEDYRPDIIISDIKMPKLDGLAMSKKIRQKDKNTPIILTTAFTDTGYLLKAVELQLIKYLIKPITSVKLLDALSMAYEYINQDKHYSVTLTSDTVYDRLNKALLVNNVAMKLTKKENQLLDLLVLHRHRAVSYEEIEKTIWHDAYMSIDTLRSLVKSLRKKIGSVKLENLSGFGYKLKY